MSSSQLKMIQDSLVEATRPSRTTTEVGGFIALLDPADPLPWINWAVPTREIDPDDISALVAHFRSNDRQPRLEMFIDLWPQVYGQLLDYGFKVEKEMPIMTLSKRDWVPSPTMQDAVDGTVDDLPEVKRMLDGAFGMPPSDDPPSESTIASLESGRFLQAVVRINQEVVGAGYAVGTPQIREIAGVGTKAEHRRQGVAGAVITRLLERFFGDLGEVAWLTPGDDGAQALYERLGFKSVGTQSCLTFDG